MCSPKKFKRLAIGQVSFFWKHHHENTALRDLVAAERKASHFEITKRMELAARQVQFQALEKAPRFFGGGKTWTPKANQFKNGWKFSDFQPFPM